MMSILPPLLITTQEAVKNKYLMTTWKAERGLPHHCPSGDPSLKCFLFFFFWPEESRIGIDILALSSRPLLHSVFSNSYTSARLLFGSRETNSLLWAIITDILHREKLRWEKGEGKGCGTLASFRIMIYLHIQGCLH